MQPKAWTRSFRSAPRNGAGISSDASSEHAFIGLAADSQHPATKATKARKTRKKPSCTWGALNCAVAGLTHPLICYTQRRGTDRKGSFRVFRAFRVFRGLHAASWRPGI